MKTLDETACSSIHRLVGRLRFRHLQLLVTLQDIGSLHAAAVQMNQTQSALSKALAEIESAFGFVLFERSPRGLTPTPRGAIAISGAAMLLSELHHLGNEVMHDNAATVLRVGAPPFIAHGYLPQVIERFLRTTSGVRVELMEERAPALFDALVQGRLDVLVTIYPPELLREAGQGLALEKLFDAEFVVVAARQHHLTQSSRVSWNRISQEPWIMPPSNAMLRRILEEGFQRAGLKTPVPVVESSNPVTNLQLVASGLGIGVIPKHNLLAAETKGLVSPVRVSPTLLPTPVAMVTRNTGRNHRTELFRQAMKS